MLISDLFLVFYTIFTFVAAVLNQLANSRLIAVILKKIRFVYLTTNTRNCFSGRCAINICFYTALVINISVTELS